MMNFLKSFDIETLIEKAMEHIDMEAIAADVMKDLKINELELYFIVDKPPGTDDYEFLGMTYSLPAAREMVSGLKHPPYAASILKLDLGKLLALFAKMDLGIVEEVD